MFQRFQGAQSNRGDEGRLIFFFLNGQVWGWFLGCLCTYQRHLNVSSSKARHEVRKSVTPQTAGVTTLHRAGLGHLCSSSLR